MDKEDQITPKPMTKHKPRKVQMSKPTPRRQTSLTRKVVPPKHILNLLQLDDESDLKFKPSKKDIIQKQKTKRLSQQFQSQPHPKPKVPRKITPINKEKEATGKTKRKFERIRNLIYDQMKIKWYQTGNNLILDSALGKYFFKMPSSWKLDQLEPRYLRLAEVVIFKPFWQTEDLERYLKEDWDESSKTTPSEISIEKKKESKEITISSKRVGIAFSGGNDSCACVPILPKDSVLVYLKRVWNTPRNILKHGQQLKCLNHIKKRWKRTSYVMETNIELISQHSIGRVGFSTDYVPVVPTILLANHYNLRYVCTGTIGLYFNAGCKAHNFLDTEHYKFWDKVFKKAKLDLFWPVGGCSDRVTDQICQKTKIPGQPCLRNDHGCCNRCFKCFRKNYLIQLSDKEVKTIEQHELEESTKQQKQLPSNIKRLKPYIKTNLSKATPKTLTRIPINKEIYNRLKKRPISRIMAKRLGWIKDKDIKDSHLKLDFSFENGYHPSLTRSLVPSELEDFILEQLDKWSRPMTEEELKVIENLDLTRLLIK